MLVAVRLATAMTLVLVAALVVGAAAHDPLADVAWVLGTEQDLASGAYLRERAAWLRPHVEAVLKSAVPLEGIQFISTTSKQVAMRHLSTVSPEHVDPRHPQWTSRALLLAIAETRAGLAGYAGLFDPIERTIMVFRDTVTTTSRVACWIAPTRTAFRDDVRDAEERNQLRYRRFSRAT